MKKKYLDEVDRQDFFNWANMFGRNPTPQEAWAYIEVICKQKREEILDLIRSPKALHEMSILEHQRWSHWQEYLRSLCKEGPDGSLVIPLHSVLHWKRQISTHYDHLSED